MKVEKREWLVLLLIPCIVGIAMLIQPPVFYLNDDMTIRSILSGSYSGTPDGHAVYMRYPLTWILALLYRICGLPWLEIFFLLCITAGMIMTAWQFKQPLIGTCVALLAYMPFAMRLHYTLVAAVLCATAVFLLIRGKNNKSALVMFLLAYMIRSQVGLLCIPFVGCALVWRMTVVSSAERKSKLVSSLKWLGGMVIGLLFCMIMNSVAYSSPEWKEYQAYNKSRTLLYDYTNFSSTDLYGINSEQYGISEQDYRILSNYATILDASFDRQRMQQVADAVLEEMNKNPELGNPMVKAVKDYYRRMRYENEPYNYICVVAYLGLAIGLIFYKKWYNLIILGLLGIGRSSIWVYLLWKGRFPERVSLSLYLIELMLLLGMLFYFFDEKKVLQDKAKKIVYGVVTILLVLAFCVQWNSTRKEIQAFVRTPAEWSNLRGYCAENTQNLYLIDVWSAKNYMDFPFTRDAENAKLMGGWMTASPFAQRMFDSLGVADAAEAIYYCEQVRFVAARNREVLWLEQYLSERFGECKFVKICDITWKEETGFVEYKLVKP